MLVQGVVVVTGANRGVGLELTRNLLLNPNVTRVYGCCRNPEHFDALHALDDPDKKLRLLEVDVSKDWAIKTAAEVVGKANLCVNLLINNAAILEQSPKTSITEKGEGERVAWLKHFDVNVVSPAMVIQEFLPLLKKASTSNKSATIVNISGKKGSIEEGGNTDVHGNFAYLSTKAALNRLTKTLALEHPDIVTLSMCPGWNKTGMGGSAAPKTPQETAPQLLRTIDRMDHQHSGGFWNRKGERIPY